MGREVPRVAETRHLARLLIALNTTAEVDRATLCRLAHDEIWLDRGGRGRPRGEIGRVPESTLERVRSQLDDFERLAAREEERAREAGTILVTRVDDAYPSPLLDLDLPPPVLYVLGRAPAAPGISIVGSRDADAYGLEAADSFARHLAGVGLTVVSGLARGVDSAAHRGALRTGATVAVLGCGIDIEYPRGSARLARRIAEAGALITEFPIGTRPLRHHFPMRNRIIAALGLGTFVVRATVRSGSLITARLALELGRDIYALPGNVYDQRSIGPNALIRDGALPVQHPREIVESLPIGVRDRLAAMPIGEPTAREEPDARLRPIYDLLPAGEARPVEALAAAAGQPVAAVLSALLELELGGWVARSPGPLFSRLS